MHKVWLSILAVSLLALGGCLSEPETGEWIHGGTIGQPDDVDAAIQVERGDGGVTGVDGGHSPNPVCALPGDGCGSDDDCCGQGFCSAGVCRVTCAPNGVACDSASDCCNGGGCFEGACVAQI